jgi:2-polyprenyl-3-methyl-5-hydroxy-6-metoxy-1,4-benzoquinol methylase
VNADLSNRVGTAVERFVPSQARGQLMEAEHLARYWWVSGLAAGRRVLDAGCGVGYGTAMLAAADAAEAIGIDIAQEAVTAASASHPTLEFVACDIHSLPFDDGRFDLVVCFEVIEHVEGQDEVIAELARVLAPRGVLAISSPNRGVYPSGNPHHLHEYVPEELRAALARQFAHVALLRQHDWAASAVLADEQVADDSVADLGLAVGKAVALAPASETYTVALAGRERLPDAPSRIVLGGVDELREGLELGPQVRVLTAERDLARTDLANLQRTEAQLREENEALQGQLAETQATLRRIHGSMLWRLGRPLRALRARTRR